MKDIVRRFFVERKKQFDAEAINLYRDLKDNLDISGLEGIKIVDRYDVEGITENEYEDIKGILFPLSLIEKITEETIDINSGCRVLATEYLPGQYDQRADFLSQCIQVSTCSERPRVKTARLLIFEGNISPSDYESIKSYLLNPIESREASHTKPATLNPKVAEPRDIKNIKGFVDMSGDELTALMGELGLAMTYEDLKFCQEYFKNDEMRDPTITEIRVIDTYWSDHCRHTTFHTSIENIDIEKGKFTVPLREAYENYQKAREYVYGDKGKDVCLMDIALIGMKELRKKGELTDLDISDEINACSIVINVDVNGKSEEWLLMFKNETHNHPTEMEPFGGAATCLGGAIRDPLSGRSYVYQAMRITGSGDPRTRVEDTIQGKLPQRKITTVAAQGYSSYGNQIGLAAGQVEEVYDPGFIAKRMELGAVIAAAPKKNVKREKPQPGDVVILLGGRTGRDGCGGATGSSKEHTEESLLQSGAQVQKGNPSEERKIQRLFRKPDVSLMIKKCNDFGAGGVSVAIGELADGLKINLDTVPQKYEGLDGTELAISESQERMAVVISKDNVDAFIRASRKENLEATPVAQVTGDGKLVMCWRGKTIVDIKREFLDTNGASQTAKVKVVAPIEDNYYFGRIPTYSSHDLGNMWVENLQRLNVCSQKGLVEGFDSTAGAATVLMPLGGRYQMTPAEGMVAKIPVLEGDTKTGTLMTFGYNPLIGKWSPFHGAMFAVIESVAKIVALGGNYKKIRLTFQEYFERLGEDPKAWGKPFSALLGAYHAQAKLGIPAIGGKDSMSGTFEDMHVPPTLVSFAVACVDVDSVISSEFKKTSSKVILIPLEISEDGMPDFVQLRANYDVIHDAIAQGKILSSRTIRAGGVAGAVSKMSFGNMIGFKFAAHINKDELFLPKYGSILLEIGEKDDPKELFKNLKYSILGTTQDKQSIDINGTCLELNELSCRWQEPLEGVFPTGQGITTDGKAREYEYKARNSKGPSISNTKPRIFIPVSPEINGEYEVIKAFEKAGGQVDTLIFKNLSQEELNASFDEMEKKIDKCQIIAVPGGGNGTDLLSGSGQFLVAAFKYPRIKEAITKLLKQRDGLMLGISEGFKTLVRLGLVPYGEIKDFGRDDVALSLNTIGRHVSCMVSTKVTSVLSPWFSNVNVGDIHTIAVSHTEGRFTANREILDSLNKNGQIAAQYVNHDKRPTYDIRFNPNGSIDAIECLTSPDGRVMGKMGYPERIGNNIAKNIPGQKDQKIFEAGINYFR